MPDLPDLSTNLADRTAAVCRAILGAAPFIGPALSEVITATIPNQKHDRVVDFLCRLDARLAELEHNSMDNQLRSPEFCDLLEDALVQASRAISLTRRDYLAKLLASGAGKWSAEHSRQKRLLRLLADLSDEEIIVLRYYAVQHEPAGKKLLEEYSELLVPASGEVSAPQSDIDRGALQNSYLRHLVSLGLLDEQNTMGGIPGWRRTSPLGNLLLKYVGNGNEE